MTEWEFTADVASWINELLAKDPRLPFSRAKCEQRGKGSLKRRDITLLDKSKRVVLTGEVKLPYQKDGGTPHNTSVVKDARTKARRAKCSYFFTWNVNEFVLWETAPARTPWRDQNFTSWKVTNIQKESHLELPMTIHTIKDWIGRFLDEYSQVLLGATPLGLKSPDERFVDALESALQMPVMANFEELSRRYKKTRFKGELDKWMREEQGWTIIDDSEGILFNLENASKSACYTLVNKLVFHEALLKRYHSKMERLTIPEHLDSGNDLRLHLERYFAEAKNITGDYETVFGEEHGLIGNRIPFYSDGAVPHWRELINQIHEFDFSKLDYEIIGKIFERLIAPEKRRKYGQFYTRVEVVDLINAFCIRRGDEKVMDPGCGGGTFLVRAYARKRELAPARKHGTLLNDLFGVDKESFAAHLTTINLATRDLIDAENYPQIARSDFFDIESGKAFVTLPKHAKAEGPGKQHREVKVPVLDAVVGNPPYIRQEDIPKTKKKAGNGPEHGTKDYYQWLTKKECGIALSGRSDIHCYFWPHATTFLKKDGFLCLLTSSQWLDVEYGFRLQEWILRNFEIVAVFESIDEPWFVGARVVTAITILRRQPDEKKRMKNAVRFVFLRRPLAQILAHDGTTAGAFRAADDFRDEILNLEENTVTGRYRVRLVHQRDLWTEGVRLGEILKESEKQGDTDPEAQNGSYYGGKWGVHLRAPEIWFQYVDEFATRLTALGKIAEIRFGVKSGKDSFFFPIDVSAECLAAMQDGDEFEDFYGVSRKKVKSGKVKLVKCGEGREETRPIEEQYLEPEVHSLMEIKGFSVKPEDCARQILLVGEKRAKLKGKYVLKYIEWGEQNNVHKGSTCASRVTKDREWYDLTGHKRGALFWPMAQQYKHVAAANDFNLICNHNLFDVHVNGIDTDVIGGILNSSWAVLSKYQYGRPVGVEGNLKTEVIDVNMMLVPNPSHATIKSKQRILIAFQRMKRRNALQFLSERRMREMAYTEAGREDDLAKLSDVSELDMDDRRELDDAVLEMLGVKSKKRRAELIGDLYRHLRDFFELTRQKEEKAIANKKVAKRRGAARPADIAEEIFHEIVENEGRLLREYDPDFIDKSKPFDTFDLPTDGTAEPLSDMFVANGVRFTRGKKKQVLGLVESKFRHQDPLIILVAESGVRGLVRFPRDEEECLRLRQTYGKFINQRNRRMRELIEDRTADEEMQEKIFESLLSLILRGGN